jgi:hypothetical protein
MVSGLFGGRDANVLPDFTLIVECKWYIEHNMSEKEINELRN